jgi:hypothetical protein
MARRVKRDEWLQDIEDRQRNVVFPNTAANEARFWRNLIDGKQRLTVTQKIGLAIISLTVATLVATSIFEAGSLLRGAINWVIALGILVAFLALFTLSNRRRRSR